MKLNLRCPITPVFGHSSLGTSNFPTSLWFSQESVLVHTVGNVSFLSENWSLSDRTTKMRFNSLDSIALCWFYRLWDYRSFMIFCTAWLVAFQEFCEIRVKKIKTEIHCEDQTTLCPCLWWKDHGQEARACEWKTLQRRCSSFWGMFLVSLDIWGFSVWPKHQ